MKKSLILIAVGCTLGAGAALASDRGFYVGGNLGTSQHDTSADFNEDSSPTVLGLYTGYAFNRHFALEMAYQDLGKAKAGPYTAESQALSLDAVGFLPTSERFRLFGKVGVARVETDFSGAGVGRSDHKTGLKLGLGAEYLVTKNLAMRAELAQYRGVPEFQGNGGRIDDKTAILTLGVNYRF